MMMYKNTSTVWSENQDMSTAILSKKMAGSETSMVNSTLNEIKNLEEKDQTFFFIIKILNMHIFWQILVKIVIFF